MGTDEPSTGERGATPDSEGDPDLGSADRAERPTEDRSERDATQTGGGPPGAGGQGGLRRRIRAIGRWTLLEGSRTGVVALLSAGIFAGTVILGLVGVLDVSRTGRVVTVFSTTITGLFTLVTITVSINQLVLSRILGSPEYIAERIDSVHDFRASVAGESDRVEVAPTEPAAFLEVVTGALRRDARHLGAVFADHHDPQCVREVDDLVAELVALADEVDGRIGSERLALFDVLLPVLGNRYSAYIHSVDRIRATTTDLSGAEDRALTELRGLLVEVNRTRHYFKTLYLHEALSSLSRLILLSGVTAVLLAYVVILSYAVPPGGPSLAHLLGFAAALTVSLGPLVVLFAYGSRVATIAGQTTTFGTFTPVEEFE